MPDREEVVRRYRSYLDACNLRAWEALRGYLAETVLVNGQTQTPDNYLDNVKATIAVFPDYRWELVRAVVEGEWLAVHLHDTGTRAEPFLDAPGDRTWVETDEYNMYRVIDGLICEVEGTADNARLGEVS